MKRLICCILLAALLAGSAGASFLGTAARQSSLPLGDGATLTASTLRDDTSGRLQNEHVLTVAADSALTPQVIYGTTLFGKSTMETIEAYPAAWGFTVAAGINGSFFDMNTGVPYGCVITDGCVRSSGDREAVGFRADGSVVIGYPKLAVSVTFPDGTTLPSVNCNKILTRSNGVNLYTRDYDFATKNTVAAYHAVLRPEQPDLKLNTRITCVVEDLVENTASCPIPEGCFVLAAAEDGDYAVTVDSTLRSLSVGDPVTVDVTVGDGWGQVVSACAGMELLVTEGEAKTSFSIAGNTARTARTAVGVRSDGTLVLYTVDRRGVSAGITLKELARRMAELDCVTALNLDGGGSTAIRARYPGQTAVETVNDPADGKLRKCANFLFLTRPRTETGPAKRLFAYPHDAVALVGGRVPLTAAAVDENYNAAVVPDGLTYSADSGAVSPDGMFTAVTPGDCEIRMAAGDAAGTVLVRVIATPDSIELSRSGGSVKSGESIAFTASASYAGAPVYAEADSFLWTCSSAIGTVSPDGVFTAAKVYAPAEGEVTCAAGDRKKSVTVTVLPDYPFPDTENHWAREPVREMYEAGVLRGSDVDGVPLFRPDDGMTRQEFLTALIRYLGEQTETYRETELPFGDVAQIAPWALDAVRAAYAMGYAGGSLEQGELWCRPDRVITRQEAVTILARTLPSAAADEDALSRFSDEADAAAWARPGLAAMTSAGVVDGAGGRLLPTAPVTRAQVAKMLAALTTVRRDSAGTDVSP